MVEEILECTPGGTKGSDSFKKTSSRNPFPGESNFKINIYWSSEQAKVSCCKLIVVPITNRVGKLKTLCRTNSLPNVNDKIRSPLLLTK